MEPMELSVGTSCPPFSDEYPVKNAIGEESQRPTERYPTRGQDGIINNNDINQSTQFDDRPIPERGVPE